MTRQDGRRPFRQERYTDHDKFWANRACKHPHRIYERGWCKRCGAKLTDPESIERGVGPCCLHKTEVEAQGSQLLVKEAC